MFTLIYSTDHAPLLWQPLTEAASAILYLRRNAADLRIAADKITIVGFSAGAHLAASTALLWDAAPVQQALGITGTEAAPMRWCWGTPLSPAASSPTAALFENLCGADEALLQTMSLENQVRPDVPPFFIWHTVEDQAVPVENSLLLAGALKENNVPFELHLFTMAAMAPAPAPTRSTPLTSITMPGCPCAWAGWGRPWILPCDLSSPMKKLFL